MKKHLGILTTIAGTAAGAIVSGVFMQKAIDEKVKKVDKFKAYYNMLIEWLRIRQEGGGLEKYFIDNGYYSIAIYGMGEMGIRLYDELKNTAIKVEYAVDKEASTAFSEIDIVSIEEDLPKVDVIIVTAVFAFDEIAEKLGNMVEYPIVSLEDVIFES